MDDEDALILQKDGGFDEADVDVVEDKLDVFQLRGQLVVLVHWNCDVGIIIIRRVNGSRFLALCPTYVSQGRSPEPEWQGLLLRQNPSAEVSKKM